MTLVLAGVVASAVLAGCAPATAGEHAARATAETTQTEGRSESDEWVSMALGMEAASAEAWTVEWLDKICGSVVVAQGDRMCTDHATTGAMLASNAPERIASLRAAGVDAHDLIEPADAVHHAAEAYLASMCDRDPTTACIGPVDELTVALPRYAEAVRAHLRSRG